MEALLSASCTGHLSKLEKKEEGNRRGNGVGLLLGEI